MPRYSTLLAACVVLSLTAPVFAASPSDPAQRRSADRDSRDRDSRDRGDSRERDWDGMRDRDRYDFDRIAYYDDDKFKLSPRGKRPKPPCRPTDRPPTDRPPSSGDCKPSKD